jgi:hypothetical protein
MYYITQLWNMNVQSNSTETSSSVILQLQSNHYDSLLSQYHAILNTTIQFKDSLSCKKNTFPYKCSQQFKKKILCNALTKFVYLQFHNYIIFLTLTRYTL